MKKAQAGGELRGYHGASCHRGGRVHHRRDREKTRECPPTAAITRSCVKIKRRLARRWCIAGQYRGAALHDARHSSEGTSRAMGPRPHRAADAKRMVMVLDR